MSNERSFIRLMIERIWFGQSGGYKISESDIGSLKESEVKALLNVIFECIAGEAIKLCDADLSKLCDDYIEAGQCYAFRENINIEFLIKFLICLTFSEFRLSGVVLYPPNLRFDAVDQVAKASGLSRDMVLRIDNNWHTMVRETVWGRE